MQTELILKFIFNGIHSIQALAELPVAAVFDVYDNDKVVAYPLVMLNVVVISTTQGELLPGDIAVNVPVLITQVGNGVHALPTHVIFS
jgi:hypothetical protein